MKYVMLFAEGQPGEIGRKIPVIFPNELVHREVAAMFVQCLSRHGYSNLRVESAGFITLKDARVHGKSESLGIEISPGDAVTILSYDWLHGL